MTYKEDVDAGYLTWSQNIKRCVEPSRICVRCPFIWKLLKAKIWCYVAFRKLFNIKDDYASLYKKYYDARINVQQLDCHRFFRNENEIPTPYKVKNNIDLQIRKKEKTA
jgi:hypothetical protein